MSVKTPVAKTLDSTDLDANDLVIVMDSELDTNGVVNHHIASFNEFTSIGINQIVTKLFKVEKTIINERTNTPEDNEIETITYVVKFDRVEIERPTTMFYKSGRTNLLMPGLARRHNLNYSAPIKVDATITAKAFLKNSPEPRVRTEEVKDFRIASMPIMVRSRLCNTNDMTAEALKDCEEDPRDPGGYFILKGQEWVVSNLETRLYNHPHIFRNVGHEKERTRLEFLSIPGDAYENSSELIIRFLESGQILLKFTSNIYLKLLEIPFHILFRLFGMTSDKEIIDNIVYGYSEVGKRDVMSDHMLQILKKAFQITDPVFGEAKHITDQAKLLKYFAKQTSIMHTSGVITPDAKVDENTLSYLNTNILRLLDKNVFPHIGMSQDTRHKKLRYLGHLIHKLFLVEHGVVESTDRDSFKNKRVNAAGRGYAKAFKTQFNLAIVQQISKKLRKSFKNMPFSQVPLAQSFKNSIYGPDLMRALIQTIVTGTKELTLKNKQISNRLASEMLHRKNQLNTVSTLRTVRTPSTSSSKQDARADEMRRVHPSYAGFLCPIQSADTGEQVGMVKQMAISASISPSGIGHVLKTIIVKDPLIIPVSRVFPEDIHKSMLTKVFVNGDWIGCTTNSPQLVYKYRDLRRGWDNNPPKRLENTVINPRTSMYWNTDSNEVQFWVDAGRLVRPILVVRNNTDLDTVGQFLIGTKYDSKKDTGFIQDICISKKDVIELRQKKITIVDLHERGVIDYICPEEMENTHIASDLSELHANRHNSLRRYTHCEVPVCLLGLPALTCPYTNHNPAVRTTFQTNQVKQTCGWYALNWPYRVDKHAFLQYYCELPLIKTISNKYVYPNGSNPIVAIATYGGHNQEDSLYLSKSSAERGQYKGISFNFIKTELESHEKFGNPDEAHTMELKKHANYAKIEEGHVKPGTMLTKGDIAIGKFFQLPKPSDQYFYRDTSVVFNSDEDAMVETVIRARNEEDNEFCKMKLSSVRPLGIGDKFCLTPDHQVLTTIGWISITDVTTDHKVATLYKGKYLKYENPTETVEFDHDGHMYEITTQQVKLLTTKNHKMYVQKRDSTKFELITARDIFGKRVRYKKDAQLENADIDTYTIDSDGENPKTVSMTSWLKVLGMFLADGNLCKDSKKNIKISGQKQRKQIQIKNIMSELNMRVYHYGREANIISSVPIYNELKKSDVGAGHKCIPDYVWNVSQDQAKIFLNTLISFDGYYNNNGTAAYYTSSAQLADDITKLALHAGWSATITLRDEAGTPYTIDGHSGTTNFDSYRVGIVKSKNTPQINHGHSKTQNGQCERYIPYTGTVHCITVPGSIFYTRKGKYGPPVWTGNSSRSGQKGMTGMTITQADMMVTESGIIPTLIMNPHGLPSRMTVNQLMEGQAAKVAALLGAIGDGTAFSKTDINAVGDKLVSLGYDRHGTERMFNGMTGEWMDVDIFISPCYYQRLQKFAVEDVYSISTGPTCAITRQPLEGKANKGGLRVGEMEKDVIISQGAAHFIMEKFRDDSDGFDIYVCRNCGKRPVVNEFLGVEICNVCRDDADIVKIASTWATKLFLQECESMNVGINLGVKPFEYEQDM